MNLPPIALYGRSGSGKSTASNYLVTRYGYTHCKAGSTCRRLCLELFGTEDRTTLNRFNDAVRAIDPTVWLRKAIAIDSNSPIVFDSMRFQDDWNFFTNLNYQTWKIDCPQEVRWDRLRRRGQIFTEEDELHPGECQLSQNSFNSVLINYDDQESLHRQIDKLLSQYLSA